VIGGCARANFVPSVLDFNHLSFLFRSRLFTHICHHALLHPYFSDRKLLRPVVAGAYAGRHPRDLTYGGDRQSKEYLSADRIEDSSDSANDYDIPEVTREADAHLIRTSYRRKGEPPVNDSLPATRRRRRAAQAELAVNSPRGYNLLKGDPATNDPFLSAASQPAHSPVASHDSDPRSYGSDPADDLLENPLDRLLPRLQLLSVPPTQPFVVVPVAISGKLFRHLPIRRELDFLTFDPIRTQRLTKL
jgi:hypothetical protein